MTAEPAGEPEPRPRSDDGDEVLIDEWVSADVCDERGQLRPGIVFEWIDVLGALAAARHGRSPAVAVAVDGCDVLAPIALGDRVTTRARVVYTSRRSIGVAVAVEASGRDEPPRQAMAAYLAVAVIGRDGKPTTVPPFAPHTSEQAVLHREGEMRRQFHRELSRDRSVLTRPEMLLVGATSERRDGGVYYLLRELGGRMASRRRRTGAGVRTADSSYVHRIEPVRSRRDQPSVPAGTLLRWLEACAAMSASAFVEAPVRLVGVHGVAFQRPVPPEVFLHLYAIAVHSDDDGVTVHVTARAEDPVTGKSQDTVRGFVTYAPLDNDVAVPAVARPGADEAALFCEVSLRKALRDRLISLRRPGRRPTQS